MKFIGKLVTFLENWLFYTNCYMNKINKEDGKCLGCWDADGHPCIACPYNYRNKRRENL